MRERYTNPQSVQLREPMNARKATKNVLTQSDLEALQDVESHEGEARINPIAAPEITNAATNHPFRVSRSTS